MSTTHFDLIVIGAGPGGYVASIRAAQLGLRVACIEKESALGGTCLRVGCIPSKALLESSERYEEVKSHYAVHGIDVLGVELNLEKMMARKNKIVKTLTTGIGYLFKKNKITRFEGHGTLLGTNKVSVTGPDATVTELTADKILIATGSVASNLPNIEWDGDRIGGSTTALSYPEVPEHLVVIGAGVIGLELGSVWARLGAKVTVLEYMDVAMPGMDREVSAEAVKIFKRQGINFEFGVKVTGAKVETSAEGTRCIVEREGGEPFVCDRVLVSVGRRPNTSNLGLESVGIETDRRGCIPVDEHFKTTASGVYAIGDVIQGPMLAHKAEEEGVACIEMMVNGYGHVNYDAIPSVVYTHPEIASVGRSEEELKAAGIPFRKGSFPFKANGRAMALEAKDGFVKILAHAETDRVLGAHIIGARAGDLIAEVAVSVEFGASAEDIGRSSHAHPTLAEIVKEAALSVDGRAINL
jgi:dihydrolipoamide dehydrogenase